MIGPGPFLRKRMPKIYFFLTDLVKACNKLTAPYTMYITDSLGGSFKTYISDSGAGNRIASLKSGLDAESVTLIDIMLKRIAAYPDESSKRKITRKAPVAGGLLPVESAETKKKVEKKLRAVRRKYAFLAEHTEESVFYYYHGLSLLPAPVIKYINGRDFVDLGAFVGDSAIALSDFNYRKIYSVEMSLKSIARYKENMKQSGIKNDKYRIINACVSSEGDNSALEIPDTGSAGISSLRIKGKYDRIIVNKKSLDQIVNEYGISPAFIKADLEGNSLEMVKGAKQTLVKFRPVLSIAVYHNPGEFFELKPYLEGFLNNYKFMLRKLSSGIKDNLCHSEVILLGYPAEILNQC
jgi:FkbM family methyltransferase